MWSRRSFVVASCVLATGQVSKALAIEFAKEALKWLDYVAALALPTLDAIFDYAIRVATDVKILTDIRARVADVRRKLTDSTPAQHLHVKLTEWLDQYDQWISEKAKPGESDGDFAARHERERNILQTDWHSCQLDAVAALLEIKYLGDELQSIDSNNMTFEEWHTYKRLLDDEKMVFETITGDMPTDPIIINVLQSVAKRLEAIVTLIDTRSADLDYVIEKYRGVK
jgi:hypothetical protein